MNRMLQKVMAGNPGVVTKAELNQARDLQGRLDTLNAQLQRYDAKPKMAVRAAAQEVYRSNPTDENLDHLEKAFLAARHLVGVDVDREIKAFVEDRRKAFLRNEVLSWWQPIHARVFDLVSLNLERVTKDEQRRAEEIAGIALGGNAIIAAAEELLEEWRRMGEGFCFAAFVKPRALPPCESPVREPYEVDLRAPSELLASLGLKLTSN